MTHVSGLRPDVDLGDMWTGYDKAIELAIEEVPTAAVNERFVYSDINFFLLGDIVRRVSGKPLDEFARERIFKPLGMNDTGFNPPAALQRRGSHRPRTARRTGGRARDRNGRCCAASCTIRRRGAWRAWPGTPGCSARPRTFRSSPACCSTAGRYDGVRILSPLTVARMISPSTPPGERNVRGLGWDMDSSFSANRGELLPLGSFGHTGFTGTSLWIDPATRMFVVFLSNRVHPDGKGDVTPLRARVATVAASALTELPPAVERSAAWSARDFGAFGHDPRRCRRRRC